MEEEELAAMRAHQEYFEQIRNAELVKTQRMEAAEKRKVEEKERRLLQERARVEAERLMREKVSLNVVEPSSFALLFSVKCWSAPSITA